MQEKIAQIETLLSKKSEVNQENARKAVDLIFLMLEESNDMAQACEYLYSSSFLTLEIFTQKYYSRLSDENATSFCNELMKIFNSDNKTIPILTKGFCVVSAVICSGVKSNYHMMILNSMFKLADTSDGFTEKKCKTFKTHLLEKTKGRIFDANYSDWSKSEIQRFFRYLAATIKDISQLPYKAKIEKWLDNNGFPALNTQSLLEVKGKEKPVEQKVDNSKPVVSKSATEQEPSEISKTVSAVQSELQKLFNNAFVKNNAFKQLEDSIKDKEAEIAQLKLKLEKSVVTVQEQVAQTTRLQEEILRKTTEIDSLNDRLKLSYRADEINRNQELDAIRKNIGTAIKLQYTDFSENKDAPCTEDNYEALKVSLDQIFRTLKRYGVEF